MTATLPILAIVVATRGGTRLSEALASVAWAAELAVLDPVGDVAASALPTGVRLASDVAGATDLGEAPWLLLLAEDEVAAPELRTAAAAAVAGVPTAWCPVIEIETLGIRFVRRRAPVRLAPRAGARVALDRTLELALVTSAPVRRLAAAVRAERGVSVSAAVDALAPESRARAALLAHLGVRPGVAAIAGAPLLALARVLRMHAVAPAGLARWVAAVLAGYRVVLSHARLWEWRATQPAPVEEVA
jgi:hypothetical protein